MTTMQEQLIPDEPLAAKPATAHAMIALLRRHYLPDEQKPAWVFAPEIQAPGPVGRKADLICLGCVAAAGAELVGHEVKVSRADVLVELADLTKSDPWQRYCNRWWLVIPHPQLIEGLELPASWGVLTPPSGRRTRSMTVHRSAPVLHPAEQAPALRTLARWQHWQLRDLRIRVAQLASDLEQSRTSMRQLDDSLRAQRDPNRHVIDQIVKGLGGTAFRHDEIGDWRRPVQVDDVVAALRDLGEVKARRDEAIQTLKDTRTGLENAQGRITNALNHWTVPE